MPIIDLRQPTEKEISEKCKKFLEKEKLSDYLFCLTLECMHCKVLTIWNEKLNCFICPKCNYKWDIEIKPHKS